MEVIYLTQAIDSLEEQLFFLAKKLSYSVEKYEEIKGLLFDLADSLSLHPKMGQLEPLLTHLNQNHRRVIEGHFKIIYFIEEEKIYITDFFDTRQDPSKMKG